MEKKETIQETSKRVLVLYVGGTIGMVRNKSGVLSPESDTFIERLKKTALLHDELFFKEKNGYNGEDVLALPLFKDKYRIIYTIKVYNPLLDSSNMGPEEWKKIAVSIKEYYSDYDGFVVVHGTDTMVYTACALSFMFQNLEKSVILTGSQLPIHDLRTDGVCNLQHSLIFAGVYRIPEVCIFFGKNLLRGNRTVKISSSGFDAFDAPSIVSLASIASEINLQLPVYPPPSNSELKVHTELNLNVIILTIYPGIPEKLVRCAFEPPTEGVILLTYGSGNIPSNVCFLTDEIRKASARGVFVVNCSQCLEGSVKPIYETNKVLVDNGALSAFDMTTEAVYTKLMYTLSIKNLSNAEKQLMFESNLRESESEFVFREINWPTKIYLSLNILLNEIHLSQDFTGNAVKV